MSPLEWRTFRRDSRTANSSTAARDEQAHLGHTHDLPTLRSNRLPQRIRSAENCRGLYVESASTSVYDGGRIESKEGAVEVGFNWRPRHRVGGVIRVRVGRLVPVFGRDGCDELNTYVGYHPQNTPK